MTTSNAPVRPSGKRLTPKERYRRHHAKHGDMDGRTCLLGACPVHYPDAWQDAAKRLESKPKENP